MMARQWLEVGCFRSLHKNIARFAVTVKSYDQRTHDSQPSVMRGSGPAEVPSRWRTGRSKGRRADPAIRRGCWPSQAVTPPPGGCYSQMHPLLDNGTFLDVNPLSRLQEKQDTRAREA